MTETNALMTKMMVISIAIPLVIGMDALMHRFIADKVMAQLWMIPALAFEYEPKTVSERVREFVNYSYGRIDKPKWVDADWFLV